MTTDIRRGHTSASNAAADNLCPGRHLAQAGLPDVKGPDAAAGSAIHEALRTGDPYKLTMEQRESHDACKAIEQKLVANVFGEKASIVSFRETRYWGKWQAPNAPTLEHSGQVDVCYRSGTKALVIDYKTLQGDVEDSPKNLQLRDLAVLVKGHFVVVDEVYTAIIQPLVTHTPEVCCYDLTSLQRAELEMVARVAASNQPNAPRKAGELQCKFCLAKSKCNEYSAWVGSMIPTGPVEPVVKELVFQTAMENWSPSQRAIAAGLLLPAGKALDEIKEFLKSGLARDPAFVPGWSLRPGNKLETITDPQACFERFNAMGGKLEDFMGTVKVGKTRLKETVNKVTGEVGKKLDARLSTLTEGIVVVTQNAPSLVESKEDKKI
jgi:Protein of unknown function (DUF2800)